MLHTILIPILAGWWLVLVSYWNLVVGISSWYFCTIRFVENFFLKISRTIFFFEKIRRNSFLKRGAEYKKGGLRPKPSFWKEIRAPAKFLIPKCNSNSMLFLTEDDHDNTCNHERQHCS